MAVWVVCEGTWYEGEEVIGVAAEYKDVARLAPGAWPDNDDGCPVVSRERGDGGYFVARRYEVTS